MRDSALQARVDDALARSSAYQALPPDKRASVASDLREIVRLLAEERAPAVAMDTPNDAVAKTGGVFGDMVDKVDFVAFVQGLVDGVFQSIVASTTKQMQQFATMLDSVVKSTKDFANTAVSETDARSMLLSSMPNLLTLGADGSIMAAPSASGDLSGKLGDMGFQLDAATGKALDRGLVDQARMKMARQRQQLLATMVLMGVNRIVVTDGEINAKVVFDVNAKTSSNQQRDAQGHVQSGVQTQRTVLDMVTVWTGQGFTGAAQNLQPGDYDLDRFRIGNDTMRSIQIPDGWRVTLYRDWHFEGPSVTYDRSIPAFPDWFDAQASSMRIYGMQTMGTDASISIQTVDTQSTQRSEAWINAHANLTGEVNLKFKSETMPLDKFAPDASADITKKATTEPDPTTVV